jgi:hypothetical protein
LIWLFEKAGWVRAVRWTVRERNQAKLVGMVGMTGQWWLDARKPAKDVVAAHLVNLAWNGLAGLETRPALRTGS